MSLSTGAYSLTCMTPVIAGEQIANLPQAHTRGPEPPLLAIFRVIVTKSCRSVVGKTIVVPLCLHWLGFSIIRQATFLPFLQ